jgi:hypothetical protein
MINPETGKVTAFEEIWRDEEEMDPTTVVFVKNVRGTEWQARVGGWQCAMGRGEDGVFWTWQGERGGNGKWDSRYATDSDRKMIRWLPEDITHWEEGSVVRWEDDDWEILECGSA